MRTPNIIACLLVLVGGLHGKAFAIFQQTATDLQQLEELLRYQMEQSPELKSHALPTLLTVPQHYWQESKADFASIAIKTMQRIWPDAGSLALCQDCDTHRTHSDKEQRLHIHNGELSLGELRLLREDARFRNAKSLTRVRETPAGVSILITSLEDGRILYATTADSSRTLNDAKTWRPFAEEYERRARGDALYYVLINLGFMQPQFQMEWVEQWGSRNQHISGVMISLISPVAALGIVYHYMLPQFRRVNFGLALLYPVTNFAKVDDNDSDNPLDTNVVLQGSAHLAISSSFGVYVSANTGSSFSLGVNFNNPILLPFLF